MSERADRILKYITWALAAALLVLIMSPAWAQGDHDCQGGHNCNDDGGVIDINMAGGDLTGGDLIGGDISTGGNKSIALAAPGLGDVDIAQCLGSEAWTLLVGGKQKLVLNQVCMAEFYLKQGRYDLAAQSLCNQAEILKEYATETACEDAHDFTPLIPDHDVDTRSDDFDMVYAAQEEEIEHLQQEQTSLVGRLDDLTELLSAPRTYPEPVAVQQIDKGAERRAKSRAAYKHALAEGKKENE